MRRLLFVIIGLFSLAACKTDKTSVPQNFECFNQPHIYKVQTAYKRIYSKSNVAAKW